MHRVDLIDLLVRAARAADIPLRLLQRVERVTPGATPALHLANAAQARADLVVGADGLHSRARVALNGADAPFFTGQVAWRATVPNRLNLPPEAANLHGAGATPGLLPAARGRAGQYRGGAGA